MAPLTCTSTHGPSFSSVHSWSAGVIAFQVRLRQNGETTQLEMFFEPSTAWCIRVYRRKPRSSGGFCHGVTNPYLILDLSFGPFLFAESLNTQTLGESGPMLRASTGRRTCHRHEDMASSRNASRGAFMHACMRVTEVG